MRIVRLLPQAGEELDEAVSRYESHQAGLGLALLAEINKARERIAELPHAARAVRGGLRRKPIRKFPYYILYRISDDEILIVAIAHRRRRPGFWRGRV